MTIGVRRFGSTGGLSIGGMGTGIKLILIAVVVAVVLVVALVVYVSQQVAAIPPSQPEASGPIYGGLTTDNYGALTYNYSNQLAEYARVTYTSNNVAAANLSLTVYTSKPVMPIYVINVESYCVQCFLPSTLYGTLNRTLAQSGLLFNSSSLNYVNINQMTSIPKRSIVVIASGLMPNILLPNVTYTEGCQRYSNTTLLNLLSDGDVVLYVGRNLSRSVSCTGQIVQNSNATANALAMPYLDYSGSGFANSSDTNYTDNRLMLDTPTFRFVPGHSFGAATSVSVLNGTFIALSNYPSAGWNDSVDGLSSDIATVLASRYWIPYVAHGSVALPQSSSGSYTIFTLNTTIPYSPTVSSLVNSSYSLVFLNLSNANNTQKFESEFRLRMRQNGDIGIPPTVGISQQVQISAQVFNSTAGHAVIAYVPLYDMNFTPAPQAPIRIGQVGSSTLYSYQSFEIPSGYYIARLDDQQNRTYSSALFYVSGVNVTPINLDFRNGTFMFTAYSNGVPITGTAYTASVSGAYSSQGTISGGGITYILPKGVALNHGNGTFEISILGSNYYVPYQYQGAGLNIPPLYIAFAIALIFIIVLNRVLVPTNVEQYFIDVPEIKMNSHERAMESPDAVVAVFDKVNSFYHWRFMPLTPEEIRSGVSNFIKYGNTRISITLRNTYALLNVLVKRGLVESAGEYYAPAIWAEQSGHSIDYLVIYRRLRDYCIANAMMFTEMDTSSKADMIVTSKGTQSYIKIYSSTAKVKDIEISQKSRSYMVFLDQERRLSFLDKLYRSYGNNAEMLKLAIRYGNIRLVDTGDLDQLRM